MNTWNRLELLVGTQNLEKLKRKTVAVVGLGGVGGYAVEMLARSGIGTLVLIDYDVIEESNCNRQLIALHSTVGQKKTDAWRKRILEINPRCQVILKDLFLTDANINTLELPIDYLIDACDTIPTKMELIRFCLNRQIELISSMGMGNKLDPTKVNIMELSQTSYDPLAKRLRKLVRAAEITQKIMVVSSTESPLSRTEIASNAFVPAVAGLLCANYVVNKIVGEG